MLLTVNYDEIRVFRRVTEFLENRKIPAWEWFLKTDITPSGEYASVMPSGWVIGRGLTDAALIADNLKLSTIGLILTGIAFYLSFLSIRQALIASSIVALCFFWARGSIGLADAAGFAMYERVYFLLVYTSIIVAGISFAERKFEFFNEAREQNPELSVAAVWRKTSPVNRIIGLTALIAILNFGTLYQIGVRGILEMGIFSALGVAYLLVLVLWFMPALHSLVCGDTSHAGIKKAPQAGLIWNRLLDNTAKGCCRLLDGNEYAPFRYKKPAVASIGIICVTLAIALVLIGSDIFYRHTGDFRFIQVHTMPLEFINNTIVDRASLFLNKEGNYGFDRMPILVMPKNASGDEPVADPAFIKRVDAFSERIRALPDAREVHSILGTIKVISRESYGLKLPAETQQAHDMLQTMEWDMGPLLKEQLWFNKGLVLGVSWLSNDSYRTGLLRDRILDLAVSEFTDLQVVPFSKIAVYPNADKYISEGKPLNVVTSQWILFVIFAVWIFIRNRKNNHAHRLDPIKTGLVINAPFVFATSAIVIVMAVLRVPLDQSTACITALAINAACDFGLYLVSDYDHALQEGSDMRQALHYSLGDKGKIILVDVVLNALCFAPLMTSSFIPVVRLGWVMIVMLLACGFGALVLMPALLPWCVKNQKV